MSVADTFTRFVSPDPPHCPEPHPDEPFAPVYDFVPLGSGTRYLTTAEHIPPPRWPDPVVFGVPLGFGEVYHGEHLTDGRCGRCQVMWAGRTVPCWSCGGPATNI